MSDPDGTWCGLTLRVRTLMRSTERVPGEATTYEDLGDPQFKGRLCLRTPTTSTTSPSSPTGSPSTGAPATERCCAAGWPTSRRSSAPTSTCSRRSPPAAATSGLTNHYYLGRKLKDDPDFPVAPAWPDQDGAGAHTNLSGVGLVKGPSTRRTPRADGVPDRAEPQEVIAENTEFAANPDVRPASESRELGDVKRDPIDVDGAGRAAHGRRQADAEGGVGSRTAPSAAVGARLAARRGPRACSSRGRCSRCRSRSRRRPARSRRVRRPPAPEALRASLVLALGVGAGTLLLGGALAALVSFYDFPGRRWLDWALVLPLAMPGYVLVLFALGAPTCRGIRSESARRHDRRAHARALPVRVPARARGVPRASRATLLEAARTLGLRRAGRSCASALPLARPASSPARRWR